MSDALPLPEGTVTFLFTDIEGSTLLDQRLGDRFPKVIVEHQRRVRMLISAPVLIEDWGYRDRRRGRRVPSSTVAPSPGYSEPPSSPGAAPRPWAAPPAASGGKSPSVSRCSHPTRATGSPRSSAPRHTGAPG